MADTPELSPLGPTPQQEFLRGLAKPDENRLARYNLAEQYYDGEQNVPLTDRQRAYLQTNAGHVRWCENFSETVVDVMAQRLKLEGFSVEGQEDFEQQIRDWWADGQCDELQGVVHTEVPKLADGFVFAEWDADEDRPCFYWNHPRLCKAFYDEDDNTKLSFLVKSWNARLPTGERCRRMNLYWPERIEKWYTLTTDESGSGGGSLWVPWIFDEDPANPGSSDGGVITWVRDDGTPRGIPAVHFRNKPKGGTWGRSEVLPVIPQQDGLNKTVLDLFETIDSQGGNRWATGVEGDVEFKAGAGEVFIAPNAEARFGQFTTPDLSGILEAIDQQLKRIAAKTQTPLHLLQSGGAMPSGETLKTAESPLVKKCEDRQVTLGSSWEQLLGIARVLANDFGGAGISEDERIEAQWEPAESRNDLAEAQVAQIKEELGVSKRTLLIEMGYDPDVEAEQRAEEAKDAAALMTSALNAGGSMPPGMPPDGAPSDQRVQGPAGVPRAA